MVLIASKFVFRSKLMLRSTLDRKIAIWLPAPWVAAQQF